MTTELTMRAPAQRRAQEPHFTEKRTLQLDAKTAIARTAAYLVHEDTTVAFSAGTTTWLVARHVPVLTDLRFVTNSLNIALALEQDGRESIIIPGGRFRTPSDALVGAFAEETLRQLHTDLLFIGAHGVDGTAGLSTPNAAEAETNRVLVANARQVVAVADATKLGVVSLAGFASLDDVDVLVTDSRADAETLERLRRRVGKLIVADLAKEVPRDPT